MNRTDFGGSNTPTPIRDLWQTPRALYETLNDEFNFVGDVAASLVNHLHPKYLTQEQDALSVDWNEYFGEGYKWLNPPYSDIGPWVEKAAEHRGVVMLIPSDMSVQWAKRCHSTADEIRLINGRISFVRADTQEPQGGNNKGSMLVIWHPEKRHDCIISMVNREDLLRREIQ